MIEPLTQQEILKRLAPAYHPTFVRLQREYIQADELIYAVANCSRTEAGTFDPNIPKSLRGNLMSSSPMFVVVTSYRWFRCGMNWGSHGESVIYHKEGSVIGGMLGGELRDWEWVFPPSRLPTDQEIGSQGFTKRVGEYIVEVALAQLASIVNKVSYTVNYKEQVLNLVVFHFNNGTDIVFQQADADLVYNILHVALKNKGKIINEYENNSSPNLAPQQDVVQKLKQLKEMLDMGLITQVEYDEKKTDILSRL